MKIAGWAAPGVEGGEGSEPRQTNNFVVSLEILAPDSSRALRLPPPSSARGVEDELKLVRHGRRLNSSRRHRDRDRHLPPENCRGAARAEN